MILARSVADDVDKAKMTIRDEEIGMNEAQQALVWNRFHSVDSARTISTQSSQYD